MRNVIRWADDWPRFAAEIQRKNPPAPDHFIPTTPYRVQLGSTTKKSKGGVRRRKHGR